jgi:hypothetical protein
MGRTFPSYTQLLERALRRFERICKYLGIEDREAMREIVKVSRRFQGPLFYNDFSDVDKMIILASLIDIYKRLMRLEKCLLEDGF